MYCQGTTLSQLCVTRARSPQLTGNPKKLNDISLTGGVVRGTSIVSIHNLHRPLLDLF